MLQSYLLAYGKFHAELARLIKQRNYDCVVLSHIISPLIPMLVCDRPLIFDYKDVYSESASAPFRFPVRTFVYWIGRLFEEVLFGWEMTIIVPAPSMHAMLRKRFGIDSRVITNGANTELFKPLSSQKRTAVRTQLGLHEDDFSIVYVGSIENWLDLETVLSALESFREAKLVLVGGTVRSRDYLDSILLACERKKLRDRVVTAGFLRQAEAAEIVSASDAAIIPFRTDTRLSLFALPDKLFEYLATGVPVISTRLPDVAELFSDFVHFYDNADDLAAILRQLYKTRPTREPDQRQTHIAEQYDWKAMSQQYQRLISALIKQSCA
jgi:glycosyltransferase involved in cell wall biosynthesis